MTMSRPSPSWAIHCSQLSRKPAAVRSIRTEANAPMVPSTDAHARTMAAKAPSRRVRDRSVAAPQKVRVRKATAKLRAWLSEAKSRLAARGT